MSTQKLPPDLELYSMWSARLGLTPMVSSSVEAKLRERGELVLIPGQRSPHVSAAVAMAALNDLIQRTGCGEAIDSARRVQQHYRRIHKAGRR